MRCLTHPTKDRFMSLREYCHMMGIPEHFEIEAKHYEMITQAVPSATARDMGEQVKRV